MAINTLLTPKSVVKNLLDELRKVDNPQVLRKLNCENKKTEIIDFIVNNRWGCDPLVENVIPFSIRPAFRAERYVSDSSCVYLPWRDKIENNSKNRNKILKAIPSVGRIVIDDGESPPRFAGTGWLVFHPNTNAIVVTNCHVAVQFAEIKFGDYQFKNKNSYPIRVGIDFSYGPELIEENFVEFTEILYMDMYKEPDIAFFRIEHRNGLNAIELDLKPIKANTTEVVTIGFPGADENPTPFDTFIDHDYCIKRVSPGMILEIRDEENLIEHDCSTSPGSSGSVILNLKTGKAVGIHDENLAGSYGVAVSAQKMNDVVNSI